MKTLLRTLLLSAIVFKIEVSLGDKDKVFLEVENLESDTPNLLKVVLSYIVDEDNDVYITSHDKSFTIYVSREESGNTIIMTNDEEDENCRKLLVEFLRTYQPCVWKGWEEDDSGKMVYSKDFIEMNHQELTLRIVDPKNSQGMLLIANELLQGDTNFKWLNSTITIEALRILKSGLEVIQGGIDLLGCNIPSSSLKEFCNILSNRNILPGFILSRCNFDETTEETLIPIAQLIKNTNISALALRNCNLTECAIEPIIRALQEDKFIQQVDLSLNRLGDTYALQKCIKLMQNKFIKEIYLESSMQSSDSKALESENLRKCFIDQLKLVSRELFIDLTGNSIGSLMKTQILALQDLGDINPFICFSLGNPKQAFIRPRSEDYIPQNTRHSSPTDSDSDGLEAE